MDLQRFGGVVMQLEAAVLQAALRSCDQLGIPGDAAVLPARWGEYAQGQQAQPLAVEYQ
ncbi:MULTISPECIES: hypothetical protein [Stenotrophomonas maltophilia group]|uniref:hypothetical protein n=1 Tax=Stenotrophomonas maltophilia group TaxID=995085 RepID=UPI00163A468D|nr:hypothetical protein [Stenotrophomonas maltophilia]